MTPVGGGAAALRRIHAPCYLLLCSLYNHILKVFSLILLQSYSGKKCRRVQDSRHFVFLPFWPIRLRLFLKHQRRRIILPWGGKLGQNSCGATPFCFVVGCFTSASFPPHLLHACKLFSSAIGSINCTRWEKGRQPCQAFEAACSLSNNGFLMISPPISPNCPPPRNGGGS